MVKKKIEEVKVEEVLQHSVNGEPPVTVEDKIEEEAANQANTHWEFSIGDADGFATIHITGKNGKKAPKGLYVPDGIIESAEAGHFVFAGSKGEARARLTAVGLAEKL